MRRLFLTSLLALPMLAGAALAQPGPVFPGPGTLLRLSETAEVIRAPDEVQASLRAEAREATAAAAQASVNRAAAAALEVARGVQGVTATTGAYRTWRQEDPARWFATQAINLRGRDQAALLELTGSLQSRGMALGGIQHGLTRDTARAARQEAASMALDALRRRAEAVAAQMGMRVERIAEIQLEAPDLPMPRPMMAEAMVARAAPAPVAQAQDIVVTAMVQATVILAPN
ncbi:SIMPL domain-containing protein [Roseomonas sp. SSH11]|uniref:SIMPL domain-containing protein n=1 Tax=Pararoseomonas baculiformis TaxID=2820812 RepID=A0ABS4ABY2_9PROT|nr:SIMPL domain-containing protein [Pararoseomonas baculiformis]MBP0444371.1 SIMPL domain-containing protein [Pararoseomonas baculiformis]